MCYPGKEREKGRGKPWGSPLKDDFVQTLTDGKRKMPWKGEREKNYKRLPLISSKGGKKELPKEEVLADRVNRRGKGKKEEKKGLILLPKEKKKKRANEYLKFLLRRHSSSIGGGKKREATTSPKREEKKEGTVFPLET